MTKRRRSARWSYPAGEKGRNRVRVFELESGMLHMEFMEGGRRKSVALRTRDKAVAKQDAERVAAEFGATSTARRNGATTLGQLFDNYLREETPYKGYGQQEHHRRSAQLWLEVLPRDLRADSLVESHAHQFIAFRKARGDLRPGKGGLKRNAPVSARSWRANIAFLKAVLRWGLANGSLRYHPGILMFKDKTRAEVGRPIVTDRELAALLRAAARMGPECYCMLVLAHETGHRIGAIRQLRWTDINWTEGQEEVHWRPELDKIGFDHTTPLSGDAVLALRRYRDKVGGIGDTWLFPAPRSPGLPVSKHLVKDWWKRMERLAGLPALKGRGWHSLRRKFASDVKRHSLVDVAAAGGWKDTTTVTKCYMQPDKVTLRHLVETRRGALSDGTAEVTAEDDESHGKKKQPRLAVTRNKTAS